MKKIISVFSFLILLSQIAIAQDGVRYVKKTPASTTEAKPATKVSVNNERVIIKDSISTNTNVNKNNNINKNSEKTSPNKKN